ncbi:FKBP-type peptidyl-prolyl cis-trans isomerase [Mucilaginibacter litoreus]|uniref:Peptidyl-prolyl cis-trans isomerase n=1 Tax=Mucilaginibacter litoreus TaxID=1048221 RepID=A0ABW3AWR1_9SPHI
MKRFILILSMFALGFASCSKDDDTPPEAFDPVEQAKIDDQVIKAYLDTHQNINATKDETGLYFQILDPGTGAQVTTNSIVTTDYILKNIQDKQLGADNSFVTGLSINSNIIDGWKIGLPKIKSGGKILLIVPSGLAYGNLQTGTLPANSILIFTVTVKSVE